MTADEQLALEKLEVIAELCKEPFTFKNRKEYRRYQLICAALKARSSAELLECFASKDPEEE